MIWLKLLEKIAAFLWTKAENDFIDFAVKNEIVHSALVQATADGTAKASYCDEARKINHGDPFLEIEEAV